MAHGLNGDLACYTEVGNFHHFHRIEFLPDFKKAFLSTLENDRCLGVNGNKVHLQRGSACLKWTYAKGAVLNGGAYNGRVVKHISTQDTDNCVFESMFSDVPTDQVGRKEQDCAKFVYLKSPLALGNAANDNPAVILTDGPANNKAAVTAMYLDNMVEGMLMNQQDTECIQFNQITNELFFGAIVNGLDNCFVFRVSYYPIR